VAVFLIVAINKPKSDSGSITTYTISTLNENESVDNCEKLENGKFVCFVGSVEISTGETIEESFDVSIDNHKIKKDPFNSQEHQIYLLSAFRPKIR